MSFWKKIFLGLLLVFSIELSAYNISVLVPCIHKHAIYLHDLLNSYKEQTLLPSEIIISISESDKVDSKIIDEIENDLWPFDLKILKTPEKKYAGENRNAACEVALGELIILQDADDIPNAYRIEIIKYFFDKYQFDILIHAWDRPSNYADLDERFYGEYFHKQIDLESIKVHFAKEQAEIWTNKRFFGKQVPIHFGNCAIDKKVFESVKWSKKAKAQDVDFFDNVCKKFKTNLMITAPLVLYINKRSSWR